MPLSLTLSHLSRGTMLPVSHTLSPLSKLQSIDLSINSLSATLELITREIPIGICLSLCYSILTSHSLFQGSSQYS